MENQTQHQLEALLIKLALGERKFEHVDAWIIYDSRRTLTRAMQHARGCYQRALLRGEENVSGSTLRGKAKDWSAHYARSRDNLIKRLEDADFDVKIVRCGQRNVLVIRDEVGSN